MTLGKDKTQPYTFAALMRMMQAPDPYSITGLLTPYTGDKTMYSMDAYKDRPFLDMEAGSSAKVHITVRADPGESHESFRKRLDDVIAKSGGGVVVVDDLAIEPGRAQGIMERTLKNMEDKTILLSGKSMGTKKRELMEMYREAFVTGSKGRGREFTVMGKTTPGKGRYSAEMEAEMNRPPLQMYSQNANGEMVPFTGSLPPYTRPDYADLLGDTRDVKSVLEFRAVPYDWGWADELASPIQQVINKHERGPRAASIRSLLEHL